MVQMINKGDTTIIEITMNDKVNSYGAYTKYNNQGLTNLIDDLIWDYFDDNKGLVSQLEELRNTVNN